MLIISQGVPNPCPFSCVAVNRPMGKGYGTNIIDLSPKTSVPKFKSSFENRLVLILVDSVASWRVLN